MNDKYHKVLVNFKICDNAKECNAVAICPIGAFFWDEERESIAINEEKCIKCDKCGSACPIGAIKIAKSKEEHMKIQKEYDNDPRKVSDLFIDRYGAQPIHTGFLITENRFDVDVLQSRQITIVEVYKEENLMCLVRAIPIKDLVHGENIKFRKIQSSTGLLKKYTNIFPSLLFFSEGKMFGKIEGFYDIDDKEKMRNQVKQILKEKV